MSFTVRPEALVEYAALIERNGINLSLSNVHLSAEASLGDTDGLWLQHLVNAHIPTLDRMSGSLYRAFHVMGGSADELTRTANHYRTADHAAEADLDAAYPASPRPPIGAPQVLPTSKTDQQGPFEARAGDDIENPLSFLTDPGTPADFSDPMALFNTLGDYLSPTWWINQVLDDTIGVKPMEFVNQHLVGDWQGFARCAVVWEQLSKATGAIGDNVNNGLRWLAADWQGQAGDAAVYYFDYLGKCLISHRDVFEVLHDKYREIARDVWLASKTLADIIKMIMDLVAVAGLAVLAGWALSWTGVGAGISWSVAAWECAKIVQLWGEASSLIATTQTAITGFVAFLTSPDSVALREISPLAVPAIDYDHPGVAAEKTRPRQKGE